MTAVKYDRMGRIRLFDAVEIFGDDLIRLVPGDRLKLALAALANALERGLNAVLAVEIVAVGAALGAELAVVVGMVLRAFDLYDLTVFYIAVQTAVLVGAANGAYGRANLDAGILAGDLRLDSFFKLSQWWFLL